MKRELDAEREAVAWLETVGADTLATIGQNDTIVPDRDPSGAVARPSTGGTRALANLTSLIGNPHQLKLGDVIGEGGMGVVRSAEQVALGRSVAVKTLKANKQNAALDLLREAWVTGALEHPNIVPVHALDLDASGVPSIVMKRIDGVEWSALAANAAEVARRFGAKDLLAWNLEILMRVLDAVRFAHSHGIVHRDLKPSNVMVGDFGEVYLLDWGIAVSLRDDGSGRFPLAKHATQLAGTPSYMAPEMLGREDGPPLSERTDVYLAGAVLYELIAGKAPHAGSNMLAVVASVIASRPELPASAPPELARICTRAMHEDPGQRFESAAALRRALQEYLEHRGSEQITERARERLDELLQALGPSSSAAGRQHDDIYRLFGACRYGFRDALAVWPGNEVAARGLVEAVVAVAEYELANGRAQAAVSLLGELSEPHPLLDRARAAAAKEAERVAELERIGRDHDKAIGTRTRATLTGGFGVIFTASPLLIVSIPQLAAASHAMQVTWAFATMFLLGIVVWWARESVGATVINRRLAASMLFLFFAQGVIAAGSAIAGHPASELFTTYLVLYAVFSGLLAISIDLYLLPAAFAYLAAFLVASHDGSYTLYLMSAGNGLMTVLMVWRWKPATLRYSEEERAAREKRRRQERERRSR